MRKFGLSDAYPSLLTSSRDNVRRSHSFSIIQQLENNHTKIGDKLQCTEAHFCDGKVYDIDSSELCLGNLGGLLFGTPIVWRSHNFSVCTILQLENNQAKNRGNLHRRKAYSSEVKVYHWGSSQLCWVPTLASCSGPRSFDDHITSLLSNNFQAAKLRSGTTLPVRHPTFVRVQFDDRKSLDSWMVTTRCKTHSGLEMALLMYYSTPGKQPSQDWGQPSQHGSQF